MLYFLTHHCNDTLQNPAGECSVQRLLPQHELPLQLPFNLPLVVIPLCPQILLQLVGHTFQELPAVLLSSGVLSRAAGGTGRFPWLMAGAEAGQEFLLGGAAGRAGAGAALAALCSPVEVQQLEEVVGQGSLVSLTGHGAWAALPQVTGQDVAPVPAALLSRGCQEGFPRGQGLGSFPGLCFPRSQRVRGLRVLPRDARGGSWARGAAGIGVIPLKNRALEQPGHSHCFTKGTRERAGGMATVFH